MLLTALAFAHSFSGKPGSGEPGSTIVGQRLGLRIDAGSAALEYIAEVPAMRVYKEAKATGADATFAKQKLAELAGNIHADWDGTPLPLTPETVADPARAGEIGFLEFHLRWTATIPSAGTLHVRNGNFPDEASYFLSDVALGPGVVVASSSLLEVRSGLARQNRHGAWVKDESARELRVEVRPAKPWEVASGEAKLPVRTVGLVPERRWIFFTPLVLPLIGVGVWLRRRAAAVSRVRQGA